LREGRVEVLGIVNAIFSGAKLKIEGISAKDGRVYFVASKSAGEVPPLGSRYRIQVAVTGEPKGIVIVESWQEERRLLWLASVPTPSSQSFWDRVATLAEQGSGAPEGLEIVIASLPPEDGGYKLELGGMR
jgi:hypothetical protein